ncbi:MAG: GGDEF domain-containing protein [Phycisphaerales bacterium]|nr:GGDEF domain-containing protein [Phycisphaerales bacterium]
MSFPTHAMESDVQTQPSPPASASADQMLEDPHQPASAKPAMDPHAFASEVASSILQDHWKLPLSTVKSADVRKSDTELGDVDLLDHLLTRHPDFGDLLLRVIACRSGHPDAQWSLVTGTDPRQIERQVPCRSCANEITWNGRYLGLLHARSMVDAHTLQRWAQWLARWMAMQAQQSGLWDLALRDELTDVWNRRYFHQFLDILLRRAVSERFRVTLMVYDIDDFKIYNDRYGHAAGDDILRETARLMRSVVRTHDVVARIGGDEFAVIFWDAQGPRRPHSQHPMDVRQAAQRFQKAILDCRFPRLLDQSTRNAHHLRRTGQLPLGWPQPPLNSSKEPTPCAWNPNVREKMCSPSAPAHVGIDEALIMPICACFMCTAEN